MRTPGNVWMLPPLVIGGVFVWLSCSVAQADLHIKSQVSITHTSDSAQSPPDGGAPSPEVHALTTYCKGDRMRVESADGKVILYDRAADRVYRLNTTDRTYSLMSTSDFLKLRDDSASADPADRMPTRMKPEVKMDLKKDTVVQARTIADRQATLYDLSGSLTFRQDTGDGGYRSRTPGGGFPGGRRGRRGGGFPGGGMAPPTFESQGGSRMSQAARSAQIEGEVWLTDGIVLQTKGKYPLLPLLVPGAPSRQILEPLADRLSKSKGFPVKTRITVTWRDGQTDTKSAGSTTILSEVMAISEETLDEAMFKIPTDYKRLDTH